MSNVIDEKIVAIKERLAVLKNENISFEELGIASGFHQAQEQKKNLVQYVSDIIDAAEKYYTELNRVMLLTNFQYIENALNTSIDLIDNIKKLVEQGVHNHNYPNQRKNYIEGFKKTVSQLMKNLYMFEHELRLCKLSKVTSNADFIKNSTYEVEELKNEIESIASESRKILANLQTKTTVKAIEESASDFSLLRDQHRKFEYLWFFAFLVSAGCVGWAFFNAIFTDLNFENTAETIYIVIKKLLLIGIPTIFLRISLTKYNLERNLRIIYSHRESVLNQYKNFENAIGDDADAKNNLRLEIAKYIFSDPQTGYLGKGSNAGEVNINPIINMADKVAKTIKPS